MAAVVWCNTLVQDKGLTLLTTNAASDKLKLVLLNTTPATRSLATSTANCCGISTHVTSIALADVASTPPGRILWFQKTTDINARKCSTKVIKAVGLINGSTLYFVTKCSTRSYSTAGPDKINASSWAIVFYDPSTAT